MKVEEKALGTRLHSTLTRDVARHQNVFAPFYLLHVIELTGTQGQWYSYGICFLAVAAGSCLVSEMTSLDHGDKTSHGICSRQWDRQGEKYFIWFDVRGVKVRKSVQRNWTHSFVCFFASAK